ncbi:hypothetical protein ATO49_21335 [Mycolicibacterium fortuitum subsp. fortuitum DSM 46621 = ATCC 6841 = JCM 6387]|nr:hypothetical protein ATO49_21335 [Mycolicibacterium fortuitum subsp. fortuitum DSM 46621 = ATCC 6841 = JCM 6387]
MLRYLRHGLRQALQRLGDRLHHLPGHLAELAHHLACAVGTATAGRRSAASTGSRSRRPRTAECIGLGLEPLGGGQIAALVGLRRLTEQFGHPPGGHLGRTEGAVP